MLFKRLVHVIRRPYVKVVQVVLLVVYMMILIFLKVTLSEKQPPAPPLVFNLTMFDRTNVVYGAGNATYKISTMLAESYKSQFQGSPHQLVYVNDIAKYNSSIGVHDYLVDRSYANSFTYRYNYFVAALFESVGADEVKCTALFNYEAYHTAAISLNLVDNALLQHYVGPGYSIQTTNDLIEMDINKTAAAQLHTKMQLYTTRVAIQVVTILFPIIVDCFAIDMITERACGSKNLHIISGLHVATYWMSNVIVDFAFYLVQIAVVYTLFAVYQMESFTDGYNSIYSVTLFLMFGWATIPVAYLISVIFSSCGVGVSLLVAYSFVTGEHLNWHLIHIFIIKNAIPTLIKHYYNLMNISLTSNRTNGLSLF